VRVDELATPKNDAELFETDPDALLISPFMTGDVFAGVTCGDETVDVAIAGHPCVIRGGGGQLMTRVPCCLLKPTEDAIAYEDWPEGHFDKFPLPNDLGLGGNQAIRLLDWASVHKREFQRARRKVALTERGVYIFQQRFTHALARVAVPLPEYEVASKAVLREAGLEVEWVDSLVGNPTDDKAITKTVKSFHKFLDEPDGEGPATRRGLLRHAGGDTALTKLVRIEIKRRQQEGAAE